MKTQESLIAETVYPSAIELNKGVSCLISVVAILKDHTTPTLNVIHKLQSDKLDLNMKKTSVSDQGTWQNLFCVSCQTTDFHTENGCTHTIITNPNQKEMMVPYVIFELKKVSHLD